MKQRMFHVCIYEQSLDWTGLSLILGTQKDWEAGLIVTKFGKQKYFLCVTVIYSCYCSSSTSYYLKDGDVSAVFGLYKQSTSKD